jgi:hypothetical protein
VVTIEARVEARDRADAWMSAWGGRSEEASFLELGRSIED